MLAIRCTYNNEPCDDNDEVLHNTNPPQQHPSSKLFSDADGVTDNEDDSFIEEIYSDFEIYMGQPQKK